jgi:hypothetical protein
MPSDELNALVAKEWMGWRFVTLSTNDPFWQRPDGTRVYPRDWHLSTDPAHAGEARRKCPHCLWHTPGGVVMELLAPHKVTVGCSYSETNGDEGKAEALTIFRAIIAALKAKAEEGESDG